MVRLLRWLPRVDDVRLAEQALVAALALEPARLGEVAGWLTPADFGVPAAGLLFARQLDLHALGDRGPAALPRLLRGRGELRPDGYPLSALLRWCDQTPAPALVAAYGRLVVEGQVARLLTAAGTRLGQAGVGSRPALALSIAAAQRAMLTAAADRLAALPGAPARGAPPRTAFVAPGEPRAVCADLEHAEQVTLGAVLVSPIATRVARWLTPRDFSSVEMGVAFATAVAMRAASCPVDRVTVSAELRMRGTPVASDLLARCEAAVPVASSVGFYARRVLSASIGRQVAAAGAELVRLGDERPGGTSAAVARASSLLDGLSPLSCRLRLAVATTSPSAPPVERVVARRTAVEAARR